MPVPFAKQGSTGMYRDLQGSTGIYKDLQGSTRIYRDLQGSTGSQGILQLQVQKTRSKKIQKQNDLEKRSSRTVETHPGDINIVVNM